jgi:hypothetical protein
MLCCSSSPPSSTNLEASDPPQKYTKNEIQGLSTIHFRSSVIVVKFSHCANFLSLGRPVQQAAPHDFGAPHPLARAIAVGNDLLQLGPIRRIEVKADVVASHVDPPP